MHLCPENDIIKFHLVGGTVYRLVFLLFAFLLLIFQNCGDLKSKNQTEESRFISSSLSSSKKPNVIFIMLDDAGYHDFFNSDIHKPYIDSLKSQGMIYTHFYTNPTCSPTRASLMTGFNPGLMGIEHALCLPVLSQEYEKMGIGDGTRRGIPKQLKTLPQYLNQNGYLTAHVGKWHLGEFDSKQPQQQGFTYTGVYQFHNHSFKGPTFDFYKLEKKDGSVILDPDRDGAHHFDKLHKTDVIGDLSVQYLSRMRVQKRPFFLNVWFNAPHKPHQPSPSFRNLYQGKTHLDSAQKDYYGAISQADHNIGKILNYLKKYPDLMANTIVMVTSDNGGSAKTGNITIQGRMKNTRNYSNYPMKGSKGQVFEGGIRLPLIVRWPGHLPAGSANKSVLRSSDLVPTLVELAQHSESIVSEGESFAKLLRSGSLSPKQRMKPLYIRQRGQVHLDSDETESEFIAAQKFRSHQKWAEMIRVGNLKYIAELDETGRHDYLFDFSISESESRATDNLISARPSQARDMKRKLLERGMQVSQIPTIEGQRFGSVVKRGGTYSFHGGQVRLRPHDLYEAHDGSFTFAVRIRPYANTFQEPSIIARKNESWTLALLPNGRVQLHVRDQLDKELTTLTSIDVLEVGKTYNVAFTMAGFTGSEAVKSNDGSPEVTYVNNVIKLLVSPADESSAPEVDAFNGSDVFNMNPSGYDVPVVLGNNDQMTKPFKGALEILTANSFALRPEHLQILYER